MKPKHFPDMATVRSLTDPARRKAELEQALENAARPTPPGFFMNYDAGQEGADDPARASAPSPWANGATVGVDKEALPSAMGPDADAGRAEVTAAARMLPAKGARKRWKIEGRNVAIAVALGLAVAAVAVAMPALTQRAPRPPAPMEAMHATAPPHATTTATAAPTPTAAPSTTATPTSTAAPSTTAASGTSAEPKAPRSSAHNVRETTDDPYDAVRPGRVPAPVADAGTPNPERPAAQPKPQGSGDPLLNE